MGKQKNFPAGKLPAEFLGALLKKYSLSSACLLAGPAVGEDAAVMELTGELLVAKTDPVTFAEECPGHYAVHVNANDIAAAGGVPRWFLASIMVPEGRFNRQKIKKIFAEIHAACRDLGVALAGGHTEATPSVNSAVVSGCMLGEAERHKLTPSGAARPGDDILLTKSISVEGTAIIASRRENELKKEFSRKEIAVMKNMIFSPGISVVKEALAANSVPGLRAMHDVTEGGLSSGLNEVAAASGTGAEIEEDSIPVLDECRKLCGMFGLDPLGLISSGSLLLYCGPEATERIIDKLSASGVPCARIGRAAAGGRMFLRKGGKRRVLTRFDRDEITRIL